MSQINPNFYLRIVGFRHSDQHEYSFTLGPWDTMNKAIDYSDHLTDTRIGEQLLQKLGVVELHTFEA